MPNKNKKIYSKVDFIIAIVVAVPLIIFSVCLFFSLWSFYPSDSAWSHNGAGDIKNVMGVIGAWYSDISFSIFGWPSYLIPISFFAIAIHFLLEKCIDKELLSWRLLMLVASIFSACVLWAGHYLSAINSVSHTGGGALGAWLLDGLIKSVKSMSIIMFFSLLIFIVSLSLVLNFPWLKAVEYIGKSVRYFFSFLINKAFSKKIENNETDNIAFELDASVQNKENGEERKRSSFTINRYPLEGEGMASEAELNTNGFLNEKILRDSFGIPSAKKNKKALPSDSGGVALSSISLDLHADSPNHHNSMRTSTIISDIEKDYNDNNYHNNEPEDNISEAESSQDRSEPDFFNFDLTKKTKIKVPERTLIGDERIVQKEKELFNINAVENDISKRDYDLSSSDEQTNKGVDNGLFLANADQSSQHKKTYTNNSNSYLDGSLSLETKSIKKTINKKYGVEQEQKTTNDYSTHLPDLGLLDTPLKQNNAYTEDALANMAEVLETTLRQFNVTATVMNVSPGPVITRFEIDLAPGIQAKKITNLSQDLARALAVSRVRVEEVISGCSYVGLEVPNKTRETVFFKDVVNSKAFQNSSSPLTLSLGADTSGKPIVADLMKMPHALVAGTTGSGKSVCINVMLLSMLYKSSPKDLRLILVDPKMLEMSMYEDIPHLLTPVITDMNEAENALTWAVAEMERRYQLMAALKVRKIEAFNNMVDVANSSDQPIKDPLWQPDESVGYTNHPNLERLPFIVIVIDELADMMMVVGKQVEQLIARLTQKARAAGIHVILATQRPSTDVLTGLIKANVPTRIAFQVSSGTDSRVIIDGVGAEKLLGHGDMLYVPPGASHPKRLHGAFVGDEETDRITSFLRSTSEPNYIDGVVRKQDPETLGAFGASEAGNAAEDIDPLYDEAVQIVLQTGKASISSVQRQLRIGYNRSARMIEYMQEQGIVSEPINGIRKVLLRTTEK